MHGMIQSYTQTPGVGVATNNLLSSLLWVPNLSNSIKFQPDMSLYMETAWTEKFLKKLNFFLKFFRNLCFSLQFQYRVTCQAKTCFGIHL
jgi:hypothetical protein